MTETRRVNAVVDAHVHLHACYQPDRFFDHAYFNLASAAGSAAQPAARACYLLMTECASDDYFGQLHAAAAAGAPGGGSWLRRWSVALTDEPECVIAQDGNRRLYVVAGRQVACREGLEVLIVADIVRTIIVDPTLDSVAVLGIIVVIRILLSFSLEAEIDGVWPWRRRELDSRTPNKGADGS